MRCGTIVEAINSLKPAASLEEALRGLHAQIGLIRRIPE
jgi:hypothetical protein